MNWDSKSHHQFSTRLDILQIKTESSLHSGVNVSETNENFNIYEKYSIEKIKIGK